MRRGRYCRIVSVRSRRGQCPTIVRRRLHIVRHCQDVLVQFLHINYVEMLVLLKDLYSRKFYGVHLSARFATGFRICQRFCPMEETNIRRHCP